VEHPGVLSAVQVWLLTLDHPDPLAAYCRRSRRGDPVIGGLASYLVGRIGFKGYPARARVATPLLRALAPHLDDAATFDDPWYRKCYRVGDLALGAFVRIAGPDRFRFADPQDATYVGYTVLPPSDALRSTLFAQARAFVITD
jgi:hypothetical protein